MPTAHRRRHLGNWGFDCTCTLCASGPEALAASDARRERLADLYGAMSDSSTVTRARLGDMAAEFAELVRTEHLEVRDGEYHQGLMRFFYSAGDVAGALEHARIALRSAERFSDPDGGFCTGLRQDLRFLEDLVEGKDSTT